MKKKRQAQKDRFVERAWETIENAQMLLSRRVERALRKEDDFDVLMDMILDADVDDGRKKAAVLKLAKMRCDDIGKLASVIGTMYDKQALVMKDPTAIVDGDLSVKKFEEL